MKYRSSWKQSFLCLAPYVLSVVMVKMLQKAEGVHKTSMKVRSRCLGFITSICSRIRVIWGLSDLATNWNWFQFEWWGSLSCLALTFYLLHFDPQQGSACVVLSDMSFIQLQVSSIWLVWLSATKTLFVFHLYCYLWWQSRAWPSNNWIYYNPRQKECFGWSSCVSCARFSLWNQILGIFQRYNHTLALPSAWEQSI